MTTEVAGTPPTPAQDEERTSSLGLRLGLLALMVGAVLLVYGRSLGGEFLYDDTRLVEANPLVHAPGAALRGWDTPLWAFEHPSNPQQTGFWRPLTVVTLALGRALSSGEAWGLHGLALLLHLLASLVAWRLAGRLFGRGPFAFLAGLLFALHPVHVQSVAWIAAINDPLFGLFGLLALDGLFAWRARGSRRVPVMSGLWFMLALLSKEQAVMVLPMALALDLGFVWFTGRSEEQRANLPLGRAYGPWLLALGLYYALRVHVFGGLDAGFGGALIYFELEPGRLLQLRAELLGGFLGLLALPLELTFFRPVRIRIPAGDPAWIQSLVWSALWLVGLIVCLKRKAWRPLALLLALVFVILPVVVLVESAGAYPLANRYLYLAVFPAVTLIAWLLAHLPRRAAVGALALIAVGYAWLGFERAPIYADEETFFRATALESPTAPEPQWALGGVLVRRYAWDQDKRTLDEALLQFLKTLMLGSDYGARSPRLTPEMTVVQRIQAMEQVINSAGRDGNPLPQLDPVVMISKEDQLQASLGRAYCYLWAGRLPPHFDLELPAVMFERIVNLVPDRPEGHLGLGLTEMERGDYTKAHTSISKAISLDRSKPEPAHALGELLRKRGDFDGARNMFEEALRRRPGSVEDRTAIVSTAIDGGRLDLAERRLADFAPFLREQPEYEYLKGMLAARRNRWTEALAHFDRVIAREEQNGDAHLKRAQVLVHLNQGEEALQAFGRACELLPSSLEANYNLGAILLDNPATRAQSRPYLERAYLLSEAGDLRRDLHDNMLPLLAGDLTRAYTLGVRDQQRGDFIHGLSWVAQVLSVPENDPRWPPDPRFKISVLHTQGLLLERLEQYPAAAASYRATLELDPDHFWTRHNLGLLLVEHLDAPGEAVPHLEHALQLVPKAGLDPTMIGAVRGQLEGTLNVAKRG